MVRRVLILVLLACICAPAGKKPKGAPLVQLPPQTVEIGSLDVPRPAQPCADYAWAAALEAMLRVQDVPLDQHYWVQKAHGGELCVDAQAEVERFPKLIDGTYTLSDGRQVRLEVRAGAGAPMPDDVIVPLREQRPLLLLWNTRSYLINAVQYQEYIYPNGQRMFQILEMRLIDPLARGKEQSFITGRDDPGTIRGFFFVVAAPVERMKWQR